MPKLMLKIFGVELRAQTQPGCQKDLISDTWTLQNFLVLALCWNLMRPVKRQSFVHIRTVLKLPLCFEAAGWMNTSCILLLLRQVAKRICNHRGKTAETQIQSICRPLVVFIRHSGTDYHKTKHTPWTGVGLTRAPSFSQHCILYIYKFII